MRSILLAKACAESQIGQIYCGSDMSPSLEWVPSLKLRGYLSEVRLVSVGPHGGPIRYSGQNSQHVFVVEECQKCGPIR